MSTRLRWEICFAGSMVTVEYDCPLVKEILDSIIYPFESNGPDEPHASFFLDVSQDTPPIISIYQNGQEVHKSRQIANVSESLMSLICHQLADNSQSGLLFHAAGLARKKDGILIPGGIGKGKSTFTAWMLSLGFDYLSDEMVYFPWKSNRMISLHRPLNIKKPSRVVIDRIVDVNNPGKNTLVGTHSDLIDPALINPKTKYTQPVVKWILFPTYKKDVNPSWQYLTTAQTGLELMKCLVNARNLPAHGFSETARLARSAQGIIFTYSSFDQIKHRILELFN